jgi:hypothetical protein
VLEALPVILPRPQTSPSRTLGVIPMREQSECLRAFLTASLIARYTCRLIGVRGLFQCAYRVRFQTSLDLGQPLPEHADGPRVVLGAETRVSSRQVYFERR